MLIPECVHEDLDWWETNVDKFPSPVQRPNPSVEIQSDASKDGRDAECRGFTTGGMWTMVEKEEHINVLELKTVLFALKSLCKEEKGCTILVSSDNSTSVACINRQGSKTKNFTY